MPEITAIKVNLKRPDRRSVYIDGEFAFSVSEGIFFQNELRKGLVLSQRQISELTEKDEFEKAKLSAVNLLSYRQRSVKEITDRLIQKGWERELVELVTGELVEKGYLDDESFALTFSRDKVKNRCLGPIALRSELRRAGVALKIIEVTVSTVYEEFPPDELLQRLLKKRGIDSEKPVSGKEKQRLVNQLRRKGFTWDQMEPCVRNLKVRETSVD